MRDYGKVQTEFWEHPGVRRLSTEAKLLYVYLLTGPHTNMAGCFKAPAGYIADDLGWVSDTVSKGFDELSAEGFATTDADSRFVLVHGFLKFNQIANPKMAIGMMKWFREVPDASPLKALLAAEVIEHVAHLPLDMAKEAERSLIPSPKPYPERYAKPENREQGTEDIGTSSLSVETPERSDADPGRQLVLVQTPPVAKAKRKPADPTMAEQEAFDAFWAIYPRRVAKKPALDAWLAAVRAGALEADIASGARSYAGERAGKDPEKTAHAATWLNAQRWTDEAAAPPPIGGYTNDNRQGRQGWSALDIAAEATGWDRDNAA